MQEWGTPWALNSTTRTGEGGSCRRQECLRKICAMPQSQQQRALWKIDATTCSPSDSSYEEILRRSTTRPPLTSFGRLCSNALVVVQEIVLTAYLLERHHVAVQVDTGQLSRYRQAQVDRSNYVICFTLLCVVLSSNRSERAPPQSRRTKVRQRLIDAVLLGVLLRFIASLLRSLTASYSSDTVQALALSGMVLHLVACDYSYANGKEPLSAYKSSLFSRERQRPPFKGGTVSLNAALFSTTLLVSRLTSNVAAYFLICIAIVLFAFYPLPRSAISASYPAHSSPVMWIISASLFVATLLLMEQVSKQLLLTSLALLFGLVLPCWKYVAQSHKRLLRGAWDIPSTASMLLDYNMSS